MLFLLNTSTVCIEFTVKSRQLSRKLMESRRHRVNLIWTITMKKKICWETDENSPAESTYQLCRNMMDFFYLISHPTPRKISSCDWSIFSDNWHNEFCWNTKTKLNYEQFCWFDQRRLKSDVCRLRKNYSSFRERSSYWYEHYKVDIVCLSRVNLYLVVL